MRPTKVLSSKYHENQIKEYLNRNALILDVRTPKEWNNGHIDDSIHIEFNQISNHLDTIQNFEKPIIVVCASGVRSGKVSDFLINHGIHAFNGGSWEMVAKLKANQS